jgi:hypothetical protein
MVDSRNGGAGRAEACATIGLVWSGLDNFPLPCSVDLVLMGVVASGAGPLTGPAMVVVDAG